MAGLSDRAGSEPLFSPCLHRDLVMGNWQSFTHRPTSHRTLHALLKLGSAPCRLPPDPLRREFAILPLSKFVPFRQTFPIFGCTPAWTRIVQPPWHGLSSSLGLTCYYRPKIGDEQSGARGDHLFLEVSASATDPQSAGQSSHGRLCISNAPISIFSP